MSHQTYTSNPLTHPVPSPLYRNPPQFLWPHSPSDLPCRRDHIDEHLDEYDLRGSRPSRRVPRHGVPLRHGLPGAAPAGVEAFGRKLDQQPATAPVQGEEMRCKRVWYGRSAATG